MNRFKDDMQEATRAYRTVRYPGDLALDVTVPRRRRRWPLVAAAAAVLLGAMLLQPESEQSKPPHRPASPWATASVSKATGDLPNVSLRRISSAKLARMPRLSMNLPDMPRTAGISLDRHGVKHKPRKETLK